MPTGSMVRYKYKKPLLRLYYLFFGVDDLHSHIRWRAIKKYMNNHCHNNAEIGGGWGLMSLEFAKANPIEIDCVEMDPTLIKTGKIFSDKIGVNVKFIEDFLPSLQKLKDNKYDQIFLIDVLEHVHEDKESLLRINVLLKAGGYLIVSVPTPNYPKFFSYTMATQIGHVRDGYTIRNLNQLLNQAGFRIIDWKYHTNSISSFLCKLWYTKNYSRPVRLLLFPVFNLLTNLDPIDRKANSCGIALKAVKVKAL